jgi:hypothetical protein
MPVAMDMGATVGIFQSATHFELNPANAGDVKSLVLASLATPISDATPDPWIAGLPKGTLG